MAIYDRYWNLIRLDESKQLPGPETIPEIWQKTPESIAAYFEYQRMAEGDALRDHWRHNWRFGDSDSLPPFPFIVATDNSQKSVGLLRRLDEVGLPYHHLHVPDRPELHSSISAPLWDVDTVPELRGEPTGLTFGLDVFIGEDDITLDHFFRLFHPRSGQN